MLEKLKLKLQILQLRLRVLLLRQKLTIPNLPKPNKIILHHSAAWGDFESVNSYHKRKWGFKSALSEKGGEKIIKHPHSYIGYQYFISRNGTIHQGRMDNEEAAHTRGQNKQSIGICLMGNGVEKDFTPEQYKSLKELVDKKTAEYGIPESEIYEHRDFSPTLCPGRNLIKKL